MGTTLEERLLAAALEEGKRTEAARQTMLESAIRRQEAIFGLHTRGLSIRAIASQLGCSPSVVQHAITQARASRPTIERRENRVTFELHRAVADLLDQNPSDVIAKGLSHVDLMRSRQRDRISREWMTRWKRLLLGNVDELKRAMLEMSPDAEDMRQMSPFLGVLDNDERILAIKKASKIAA